MDRFHDLFEFPLADDVKKTIEEILKEEGAKRELMRVAVLDLIRRKGGEIRLNSKQSKSLNNLEEIIDISSRYVQKYQEHKLIEGAVLLSPHSKIGEGYDISVLFILSDLALPTIKGEWEKGMGDTPVGGLWDEWEIFKDNTLPHDDDLFEGKVFHPLFMTTQMIRNDLTSGQPDSGRFVLSWFREGVTLKDKRGVVQKIIVEVNKTKSEDFFKYWKHKYLIEFNDLVSNLNHSIEQGDMSTAEILSVESVKKYLQLMFSINNKIEPHSHPGSKSILLASRKHLNHEIVEKVEKILWEHDLSKRYKLLKKLPITD